MFFIPKEAKEAILDFFTKNCKGIPNLFSVIIISA